MLVALVMAIVFGGMPEVPSFLLQDLSCIIMNDSDPATRPSPLDSVMFSVGGRWSRCATVVRPPKGVP